MKSDADSKIRSGSDLISVISLPKLLHMHLLENASRALSEKYVCHSGKNIGKICRAFAWSIAGRCCAYPSILLPKMHGIRSMIRFWWILGSTFASRNHRGRCHSIAQVLKMFLTGTFSSCIFSFCFVPLNIFQAGSDELKVFIMVGFFLHIYLSNFNDLVLSWDTSFF